MNRILVGDVAPSFTLRDQSGNTVTLEEHRGKPLVLFFYPKDGTPGCTAEACAFRDSYDVFRDAGTAVVGISSDSRERHARFASKHSLQFPILSDPDGRVRNAYGVPRTLGVLPGRTTFVIGPDGVVRHTFTSQLNIQGHIDTALDAIRTMEQGKERSE